MSDGASSSVTVIELGGTTYHLLGTAHVSERSVAEVREVILRLRPEVVCIELDQGRHDALVGEQAFRDLDVFKVVREGRTLYLLAHLALAAYQKRMGAALGVRPGAEMLAAIRCAEEIGAKVVLVDRDVNITLKRTWANIGLWKRSMMLSSLIVGFGGDDDDKDAPAAPVTAESIEQLKEPKALSEMLAELSTHFPQIKGPLIDERDDYMAAGVEAAGGAGITNVVAVVGAAHVPGMTSRFGTPVDRAALARPPKPSLLWTVLKWAFPAILIGLFVWGFFLFDTSKMGRIFLAWLLPTSIGAGLMTAIAGGRPLSILSALLVAPIAALHPLLGTGMVVGVVEAYYRRPTVADCERLPEDIQSMRGFWRNPVTRILIIAALSGVGTAAGFWIGLTWVATII